MTTLRSALRFSFLERYALIALALASSVLLARLLTPDEIGIYSVTAALVGIAQMVRDFGVGNYLIQERDLTADKLDSAFGFSVITGVIVYVVAIVSIPTITRFYGDARVSDVLHVVCINFLALPFCTIGLSLLRRRMQFDRLLVINLAGASGGFVSTLGLAFASAGPKSLAWGGVICNVVTAVLAWISLGRSGRPGWPRLVEWRSLLAYGRQSTLAGIVVSAAADTNDLIVGKLLGFTPVAILSRAMGLMNLFQRDLMGAARNVAFPAFAQAHREGKSVEVMFVQSFALVTGLGWPFYGFLCLFPLETLRLMAGPQWDSAAPLVVIFAVAGATIVPATLTQTLIMATGRVDLASRADVIVSVLRLASAAIAAAVFGSVGAVAMAVLLSFAAATPIFFLFKQRCVPSDWRQLMRHAARSMSVACVTLFLPGGIGITVASIWGRPLSLWVFMGLCLLTVICWMIALHVCKHPISKDPYYSRVCRLFGIS